MRADPYDYFGVLLPLVFDIIYPLVFAIAVILKRLM
jgi:hypothetical protein